MVQLMKRGDLRKGKMVPVKMEVEDALEEEHGPLIKRPKSSTLLQQQQIVRMDGLSVMPTQYNPLDEPSPLGLRLRKSPSLLELIQMRLSQGNPSKAASQSKKEQKGTAAAGTMEKLKASNFPASILRIGTWEYKSRYEGDLVAKCYFANHKFVWEVLDGGLKNKIEIQWSDIMALKANYPGDEPGTLDVVLGRQPLFFRETNPQPRKHTLWQATSDFTGGQASLHRRHFLQCPPGLLGKHFEKLTQCDPLLNILSQQSEIILDSPYFEPRISAFDDPNDSKSEFSVSNEESSSFFSMGGSTSPCGCQSSTSKNELDPFGGSRESIRQETPSPSCVMDTRVIEEIKNNGEQWKAISNWDQISVPGLRSCMSMSDLVSHLETRVSEQKMSSNVVLSGQDRQGLEILEEITRCLFSDSQFMPASDEKSLMSRVNSLCCLLQKDPPQTLPCKNENSPGVGTSDKRIEEPNLATAFTSRSMVEVKSPATERDGDEEDTYIGKPTPSMLRKDSVGELLLNLPRIASLPQFLFNISEDVDNQAC